jgi:hypothetical protein
MFRSQTAKLDFGHLGRALPLAAGGTGEAAERVGGRLADPRQETPPCTCRPASLPSS